MSKYAPGLALLAIATLSIACFLPWTWHEDLNMYFTGFQSKENIYGKPGKFLLIMGGLTALSAWVPRVWAKRAALLISSLNAAYALKTYLVFSACYLGYCPVKQVGIYLMLTATFLLLFVSLFPKGRLPLPTDKSV